MDALNNRSWVDEMENEDSHHRIVCIQTPDKEDKPVDTQCNSSRRKIFFVKDENACDGSRQSTNDGTDLPSPKTNSSYANILKASPDTNSCQLPVSDATPKKEAGKDFLQEDISLSSHLDVFHVESPGKLKVKMEVVNKDEFPELSPWSRKMKKPAKKCHTDNDCKEEVLKQTVKTENCADQNSDPVSSRRRAIDAQEVKGRRLPTDDVLMPSPSKITRQSKRRIENSPAESRTPRTPKNEFRKRQRDFSSPASGGSSRNTYNKYENDPAVLARRQKQIDYGKNTVGYDRYIASVPRKERGKNHPQTPPLHLQYSRRAWDGLVKIWRKRLHFWDPPSEGGGDPALLEDDESSIGDMSVDMGSVMSTPQQESKRRRGLDCGETKRAIENGGAGDDDDDDDGCEPLPIEDWILMGDGESPEEDDVEEQEEKDIKIKDESPDEDDGELKIKLKNEKTKPECP